MMRPQADFPRPQLPPRAKFYSMAGTTGFCVPRTRLLWYGWRPQPSCPHATLAPAGGFPGSRGSVSSWQLWLSSAGHALSVSQVRDTVILRPDPWPFLEKHEFPFSLETGPLTPSQSRSPEAMDLAALRGPGPGQAVPQCSLGPEPSAPPVQNLCEPLHPFL